MVGDGCAGPPYPSIRIDQASASAIGLADGKLGAFARVVSVDLGAADPTTEDDLARFVLMARHYSAILRRHATPLGFEVWNGPVALQVR
jgi:hypothetical protein